MVLVLQLNGRWTDVDYVTVIPFLNKEDAEQYCIDNTDNPMRCIDKTVDPMDEKYWSYCKIINPNQRYEIGRYFIG